MVTVRGGALVGVTGQGCWGREDFRKGFEQVKAGVGDGSQNDCGNWGGPEDHDWGAKGFIHDWECLKVGSGGNGGGTEGSIAVGMNFMGLGLYGRNEEWWGKQRNIHKRN